MVSGKCPHPWNKTKKGTFTKGHKNYNTELKGCFKKGHKISQALKEKNKELAIQRYKNKTHPFFIPNKIAFETANKSKWYNLGKAKWKELSARILQRDNYICQSCGKDLKENKYNCHHIVPYSINQDNSETNLVSLCIPCHTSIEYFTKMALWRAGGVAVDRQCTKIN